MFFLLGRAWVVGNYFVKLATGGWERKQLQAFSSVNNHKIYLEKPCRVTTEIQCLGIGSSLLKKKKMKKEEKDIGREGYYPGMQKKANIIKEMAFPAYSTPGEAAAWQVPREGG